MLTQHHIQVMDVTITITAPERVIGAIVEAQTRACLTITVQGPVIPRRVGRPARTNIEAIQEAAREIGASGEKPTRASIGRKLGVAPNTVDNTLHRAGLDLAAVLAESVRGDA